MFVGPSLKGRDFCWECHAENVSGVCSRFNSKRAIFCGKITNRCNTWISGYLGRILSKHKRPDRRDADSGRSQPYVLWLPGVTLFLRFVVEVYADAGTILVWETTATPGEQGRDKESEHGNLRMLSKNR